MNKPHSFSKTVLGLGVVCLVLAFASVLLGAAELAPGVVLRALLSGPDSGPAGAIVWYARLPRTAATLLCGSALAVSGCVIQAVLGNPLASPSVIGVNAGAGLAVTALCAMEVVSGWAIAAGSFLGAFGAALVVTLAARRMGASRSTVILGGVAVNSFFSALREVLTSLKPDAAALSADFRIGGFGSVAIDRVYPAAVIILVGMLFLFTMCSELELLTLGEETARSLGLCVGRTRTLLLVWAAALAGASVSVAGLLGFVGLIVPHMARYLVGTQTNRLLPTSALLGAALVTLCDLLGRLIAAPYELSAGIFMALLGGPFFLYLLKKRGGGDHYG